MADNVTEKSNYGWELLYALYKKHFTSEVNVVIVWTHFNLLRRGFKNVGLGEDITLPKENDLKETLPQGWWDIMPCRLRYFYDKRLYLLTIQPPDSDGDIIINLNRPYDNNVEVTTMQVSEIKCLNGTLEDIMPDWPIYMKRIADDMIDPLLNNEVSKDVHVQTDPEEDVVTRGSPRRSDIPLPNPLDHVFMIPGNPSSESVGSADLNPLGVGGGMLYQPPGIGPFYPDPLLPRGSIPPRARFDPIFPGRGGPMRGGPFSGGSQPRPFPRGNYPDLDHLPPPGYDDMFS